MKPIAASFALACAILAAAQPLAAQPMTGPAAAPRLSRPAPDKATIGSLVVDIYARYARISVDPTLQGDTKTVLFKGMICGKSPGGFTGASDLTAALARELVKSMPREARARLKAADPAALTDLAVGIIARADGVTPDAIRADEALGPGVYHDPIEGLRFALVLCQLYGVRP